MPDKETTTPAFPDEYGWAYTHDGWRSYVQPSTKTRHLGRWWAMVQRADINPLDLIMISPLDVHKGGMSRHDTEQQANDWCIAFIEARRNSA